MKKFHGMTKIGSNIKKIRKTKGLTQQSFADLFDISRGNISSYEEDRAEPRIETIIKIANYFSIPLESLLTKELTVNEILQYNTDRLLEEEHKLSTLKIKVVPYINEDILVKGLHGELSFEDFDAYPLIKIPETNPFRVIALSFNSNIPHHQLFEKYTSNDILFFVHVSTHNIHLVNKKAGLLLAPHQLTLGQFQQEDGIIQLTLNQQQQETVDLAKSNRYWKLFATYQHTK
ncbi:MAG: hypothetical protein BGO09_01935 [Bacteroidetes bacterium 47-18]|mgnify:CR=1 FL=1|nr:MAG: hypothetical protein BGO09_01935 [Bacteroidetes bacterium 47-18]